MPYTEVWVSGNKCKLCVFHTRTHTHSHTHREAVLKLQKACPIINYSTDPPQYETKEDLPNLPGESMITRFRNQ